MSDSKALRKRCPRCKKIRAFYEPRTEFGGRWTKTKVPGQRARWGKDENDRWVCFIGKCERFLRVDVCGVSPDGSSRQERCLTIGRC